MALHSKLGTYEEEARFAMAVDSVLYMIALPKRCYCHLLTKSQIIGKSRIQGIELKKIKKIAK